MARILIIDDDIDACETMASLVSRLQHQAEWAHTLNSGIEKAQAGEYDLVFLDVFLPDGNGLSILPNLMALDDPPEVIILTGKGNPDGAELAIKGGVWDYLLKPTSIHDITQTINRALSYRQEKKGQQEKHQLNLSGVIGISHDIEECLKITAKAATSDSNVLITGETGPGKELFASTIHANSSRANGNFVVVDCTSLTESLVESTLFGHVKGSFTGAQGNQQGLIKTADGGTLFLDEVGEMPLSIQKVFLRVLQERQFRPVGATKEQTSNFRLIAATNRDLEWMVEKGLFRQDLLFRIKTIPIQLPPLRQRSDDIEELANFRVTQLCKRRGMENKHLADDFLNILKEYHWPGNVRELFNILERAVIHAGTEPTLFGMHLPRSLRIQVAKIHISRLTGSEVIEKAEGTTSHDEKNIGTRIFEDIFDCSLPPLKEFKNTAEKIYLGELIRQCDGNVQTIMDASGLSRSHLYSLLKKYNLTL